MKSFWSYDNLVSIGRTVNLVLAIVAVVWLTFRRVRNWELFAGRLRNDIWLMAYFWSASLVIGTIEQLFHTGTSIRVVFATAAIAFTIRILWKYNKDWYAIDERAKP